MLFADSETQKLLRDTARSFLRDRYPWERLYALERGEAQLSAADLKEFAGLGWLGLIAPESAGGAGASLLEAAVVVEELGYAGVPSPVPAANIAAYLLGASASPDAASHLRNLTAGLRLYTFAESNRHINDAHGRPARPEALEEPALSAQQPKGRAEHDAPVMLVRGRLTGVLPRVPFGGAADYVLAPITAGPAFALLPLDSAHRARVRVLDRADYCNLRFEDAPANGAVVLAEGADAGAMHDRCDALSTAFSLIELAGLMQRVTEMTAEYIGNRVQFGVPIAKFQAARHHAADMLMQTQTGRWTAYQALDCFQRDPADTAAIWLARHWAIRAAGVVFELAHLLHGGVGVGTEYPLHLLTQGVAAFAVRAGAMNEMVARINKGLRLANKEA